MLDVNDILSAEFGSNLGGYRKADVDAFREDVSKTVEALYKENGELVRKLQVLAQKVEEYRKDESNIQSALLIAQRAGEQIVKDSQIQADEKLADAQAQAERLISDAKVKADEILKKTEDTVVALANDSKEKSAQMIRSAAQKAEALVAEATEGTREKREEFEELKKAVSDFRTSVLLIYKEHLELINSLPAEKKAESNGAESAVIDEDKPAEYEEPTLSDSLEDETEISPVYVKREPVAEEPFHFDNAISVDEITENSVAEPAEEPEPVVAAQDTAESDSDDAYVLGSSYADATSVLSEEAETAEKPEIGEAALRSESANHPAQTVEPDPDLDLFTGFTRGRAPEPPENADVTFVTQRPDDPAEKINSFVEPPKEKSKKRKAVDSETTEKTDGQLGIDLSSLKFGDDYSVADDEDDDGMSDGKSLFNWRNK